jgi:filamentous hemagglutinin
VDHKGTIQSDGDLTMVASRDIKVIGADLLAKGDTTISAGRNLEVGVIATHNVGNDLSSKQTYGHDDLTHVTSTITGNKVALFSKGDATLTGAQVSSEDKLVVAARGNLLVNSVTDIHKEQQSWNGPGSSYAYQGTNEKTIGSNLLAQKDMEITAVNLASDPSTGNTKGGNITVEGSHLNSTNGKVQIIADQDVTIKNVLEKHESLTVTHSSDSGLLSSKTKDTKDYALANQVVGSTISGDQVVIQAGKNLNIKGSNLVGTNDVALFATENVNITSAKETGKDEHFREEKTSGLFSGGGLGFTIGSKSEKTTATDKTLAEIGSTIGSINGNVTIKAGEKVNSAGTTFVAGKDLNIIGKEVSIDNTINTVDSQSKYEFKQSGISVSVGGGLVNAATGVLGSVTRSGEVQDDRLKALYAYKAVDDAKKLGDYKGDLGKGIGISVSLGSSQMTSEQTSHTETVNTSNINAGGNVTITATEGDVKLNGTKINAVDITLDAKNKLIIDGAENKQQTASNTNSSSWSLGGTIGGTGISANISKGSSKENENATTNVGSVVDASGTLTLKSGSDTDVTGSQVKGYRVVTDIKGSLHMTSVQDTDTYTANSQNSGLGFSTGPKGGVNGSASKGKTDSNYASVTNQAGIFAGDGGFDIHVGKATDLKGAVIASTATPDKNKLTTETLTYSDIENKADYNASSVGVNYATGKDVAKKDQGLTPNIGVTASENADSTTKSAIEAGTAITITGNQTQDLSGLSRDTGNSLNTLGKIFDKKTIAEQQELAGLFGQEAFKAIGDLGLKEGSPQKVALDAFAGGLMAKLGGGSFASGATGAGVNQLIQNELANIKDPAAHQWASALVGGVAAKLVGGNAQTGASTAISETKNNFYMHPENIPEEITTATGVLLIGIVSIELGKQYLKDKSGKILATLVSGEWVSNSPAPTMNVPIEYPQINSGSRPDIGKVFNYSNVNFPIGNSNVINSTQNTESSYVWQSPIYTAPTWDIPRWVSPFDNEIRLESKDRVITGNIITTNPITDFNLHAGTVGSSVGTTVVPQDHTLLPTDTNEQVAITTTFPGETQPTTGIPSMDHNKPDSSIPAIPLTGGNKDENKLDSPTKPVELGVITATDRNFGGTTKNTTTLWDIKTGASEKIDYNINGAKVSAYKDPKTGLYWARDTEGHGGSAYKVFESAKGGRELRWVADADTYGNYIADKHKGSTGLVIKVK